MSLKEQVTSTTIGYCVAVCTQIMIFPLFDIYVPHSQNFVIAGVFTVISLARGFMVRRFFNWLEVRKMT